MDPGGGDWWVRLFMARSETELTQVSDAFLRKMREVVPKMRKRAEVLGRQDQRSDLAFEEAGLA
jgi:hypothetical protein